MAPGSSSPPKAVVGGTGGGGGPSTIAAASKHHHHHGHSHHHHSHHNDKDGGGSSSSSKKKHGGSSSSSSSSKEDQRLARRYFQIQDRCLTVLRLLFAAGIPLTIINISFAAAYAWIYANQVGAGVGGGEGNRGELGAVWGGGGWIRWSVHTHASSHTPRSTLTD